MGSVEDISGFDLRVYGRNSRVPLSEDDIRVYGPANIARWSYAAGKAMDNS